MIFISIPPLTPARLISAWAARQKVPVVADIIDPWPDALFMREKGLKALLFRALVMPLSAKLKRTLSAVSGVTAISRVYLEWARGKVPGSVPGAFFYPAVRFREIQAQLAGSAGASGENAAGANGELSIIYAGSLESSYDIPAIIGASQIMEKKHPGRTRFIIAGKGSQEELVRSAVERSTNLEYVGRVGSEELLELFSTCQVGLIQHKPGATQTVTYKLFDYLGAGLTVINSLKSEMVKIIHEHRVGFNHRPGDAGALAERLERFLEDPELLAEYRKNALQLTAEQGDAGVVYDRLAQFLEQVSSS